MTAEDFAFYAAKAPICFFRLGVGNNAQGIKNSVHHPNFDIDPRALEVGLLAMASIPFMYEV
jgi:amidohydrolase